MTFKTLYPSPKMRVEKNVKNIMFISFIILFLLT